MGGTSASRSSPRPRREVPPLACLGRFQVLRDFREFSIWKKQATQAKKAKKKKGEQLGHGDAESQDEPVVVQALEGEECDEIICGKGEQANAPIVAARW